MNLYLAGKITGDPDYREKFALKARELEEMGYTVLNPARLPDGLTWGQAMDIARAMLGVCKAMYIMAGAETSAGVAAERVFAKDLGIVIYEERP